MTEFTHLLKVMTSLGLVFYAVYLMDMYRRRHAQILTHCITRREVIEYFASDVCEMWWVLFIVSMGAACVPTFIYAVYFVI